METTGVYRPLLGTDVEIRIAAADAAAAATAERVAVEQVLQAQGLFSAFDPDSALSRWRGGARETPAELARLLALAAKWHARTGGAVHPATTGLRRRWVQAQEQGREPTEAELADLVTVDLPYAVDHSADPPGIRRHGDCSDVDLNALAKGYAVDLAVAAAARVPGVRAVTVNAGGDLRHTGAGSVRVGVEDPDRPAVNAPRLAVVELAGGSLATSGPGHRGFRVGGRWFGHVLDPRTGRPVSHTRSATVLAADATTADALATAAVVLAPEPAIALADRLGVGLLLVAAGPARPRIRRSHAWPAAAAPSAGGVGATRSAGAPARRV